MNESSDRDRMDFELERRPTEAENIGVEFTVSTSEIDSNAPSVPSAARASRFRTNRLSNW
jgi:hypothetical protein